MLILSYCVYICDHRHITLIFNLHVDFILLCSRMEPPPHNLHVDFLLSCSHIELPPQVLHVDLSCYVHIFHFLHTAYICILFNHAHIFYFLCFWFCTCHMTHVLYGNREDLIVGVK